ncbi:MAG: hypothetical protein BYD32DRAFT_418573 [Podila humilis]|nr:MAG: hypothetical protein BYD32DRAFT_418573 [Podila humilis]
MNTQPKNGSQSLLVHTGNQLSLLKLFFLLFCLVKVSIAQEGKPATNNNKDTHTPHPMSFIASGPNSWPVQYELYCPYARARPRARPRRKERQQPQQ